MIRDFRYDSICERLTSTFIFECRDLISAQIHTGRPHATGVDQQPFDIRNRYRPYPLAYN